MRRIKPIPADACLSIVTSRNHKPLFWAQPSPGNLFYYQCAVGWTMSGNQPREMLIDTAVEVLTAHPRAQLAGQLAPLVLVRFMVKQEKSKPA